VKVVVNFNGEKTRWFCNMTPSWQILPWLQNIFKLKFQGQSECFMVHIFMQNHASNENLAGLYHLLLQGICL